MEFLLKRIGNHSIIGWLNLLICQWFFFRIYYITPYDSIFTIGILFLVFPTTGWGCDYYPKNYKMIRLIKWKL